MALNGTFIIEKILAHHRVKDWKIVRPQWIWGTHVKDDEFRYHVRWEGYGPNDDTYEPLEHIKDTLPFHDYLKTVPKHAGKLGRRGLLPTTRYSDSSSSSSPPSSLPSKFSQSHNISAGNRLATMVGSSTSMGTVPQATRHSAVDMRKPLKKRSHHQTTTTQCDVPANFSQSFNGSARRHKSISRGRSTLNVRENNSRSVDKPKATTVAVCKTLKPMSSPKAPKSMIRHESLSKVRASLQGEPSSSKAPHFSASISAVTFKSMSKPSNHQAMPLSVTSENCARTFNRTLDKRDQMRASKSAEEVPKIAPKDEEELPGIAYIPGIGNVEDVNPTIKEKSFVDQTETETEIDADHQVEIAEKVSMNSRTAKSKENHELAMRTIVKTLASIGVQTDPVIIIDIEE